MIAYLCVARWPLRPFFRFGLLSAAAAIACDAGILISVVEAAMALPDVATMALPDVAHMALPDVAHMALPDVAAMALPDVAAMALPDVAAVSAGWEVVAAFIVRTAG